MKKRYETPECQIEKLALEDVIRTSLINGGEGDNSEDVDFGGFF